MKTPKKLELDWTNLRKKVNPEKEIYLTDLNLNSFNEAHKADEVVYTSPSGKIQVIKAPKTKEG